MHSTASEPGPTGRPADDARRGLALFLGLVVVGSAPLLSLIVRSGASIRDLPVYVLALMWVPALASVITRVATGDGFDDLSFALRRRRVVKRVALAVLSPVAVGGVAYGLAWATGVVSFAPPADAGRPLLAFGAELLFAVTVGTVVGVLSAAGEEIGWRGYMLPRMIDAGIPVPVLTGGVVWGLWHVPAILTGQYAAGANPALSAALFVVLAVALTALWTAWTLETGSVWPAIFGHAA
ncbi:MAG: type II CAAX prenyl endopeptidase Rce1 family protein [Halobacteriaceae archaeon]